MRRVSTQPIIHVQTPAALEHALSLLVRSEFVALDTEFMRESTYYPKLCLVQLATPQASFSFTRATIR